MATAQEQPASSPATCWQRTFRWLKRVTAFLWGTIIVGLFINVVSTISTSTTDTPLSKLLVVHWVLTYPIFVISGAAIFLLLTIVSWIGGRERKASSFLSPEQQSRLIILKSLRKAYTDELDSSLQGMARIALGLHERFDLTHSARLSPWGSGQSERILPERTTIVDVYEQAGNGLLILGEPGAGKSTLLYDLAQALLSRVEQDESQPLPVLLNLSSWATRRLPLEQWLVEELLLRYRVPRQQSQRWVQQTQLLLLLDGLDEVAASTRGACIEAINTYQSEHLVPLVVCSRREEYQAMSERLTLQSAIIIQPLSSEQVKAYLARAGEGLAAVQTTMHTNPVLEEMLTTPLMLSVVTLTYKDKAVKDLPQLGSPEEQQRQVFEHYVTHALKKKRERLWCYASQPTTKWLSWLAQQMQAHSLSEFYLENLRPTWFGTKQANTHFKWLSALVVGLLGSLAGGLPIVLVDGLVFGLVIGLFFGLFCGLLGGVRDWEDEVGFTHTEVLVWSWRNFLHVMSKGWRKEGFFLQPLTLLLGLLYGLLFRLIINPNISPVGWLSIGLSTTLGFWLVGTITLSVFAPFGALSGAQIAKHMRRRPNQGIKSLGRNALRIGLVTGLILVLLFGLLSRQVIGLAFVPIIVLMCGLMFGGLGYLHHYILRFLLWRSGAIPLDYVRFLEEAKERILLQRVGGGYRFIHPLFQKYFASVSMAAPSTDI